MKGSVMPIEYLMETVDAPSIRWRNLVTNECRSSPPRVGELDWIEVTFAIHCP